MLCVLCVANTAFSAGTVSELNVEGDIVVFATSEDKTQVSPACVNTENAEKWTVSLANQSGRATYSMLLSAMTMDLPINVSSAEDCADKATIERARRVWFEN